MANQTMFPTCLTEIVFIEDNKYVIPLTDLIWSSAIMAIDQNIRVTTLECITHALPKPHVSTSHTCT
jgi:hypothetical protein